VDDYNNIVIAGTDMPVTDVRFFKNDKGVVPVHKWLKDLEKREPVVYAACLDAILQLTLHGHELRRPMAAFLRNGIYELRIKVRKVHYRIVYFFYGRNCAALSDGISGKKGEVDPRKIDQAVANMALVESSPRKYTVIIPLD
jgi:hypothetical protein